MNVENLESFISRYAVDILKEKGIRKLFPPQEDVINSGLFSKKNFVIAIPTASGKTLLAELAMLREVMEGGKCLYIVPLRALAVEKYEEFYKWNEIGVKTSYSIGDFESREESLVDSDIIVTTSEKADSFLRNGASWINQITCIVLDEIHLLDSERRGPVIEIIVAKFRKINPKVRFIALSATIPNADEISGWLNAELYFSDWRPTKLYEGVYSDGVLELVSNGEKETREIGRGDISALTADCLREGGQVLVFDSTRRNAEATARKLSTVTMRFVDSNEDIAKKILEENEGEMSKSLAECIRLGSAFHHAGLLNSQRKVVEDAFRDGKIKVVVATPTLAAGVNLPARRVIIKSYYRFEGYAAPIKVMEYKQMAGRAGRPGLDPRGEAILIVRNKRELGSVFERYIFGKPEDIESKLGVETHLRFHTLSLISEGFAKTMDELNEFFSDTFFFYQNKISPVFEIERVVGQLEKWDFIKNSSGVILPTSTGRLVSKLYIDPLTGFIFIDSLKKFSNLSEIATLHLICRTPDMEKLYLKKSDDWVEDEAFSVKDDLTYYPSGYSMEYDWFLREFKTALCIQEWINEEDEDGICDKFGISPGDLRRIVETAEWLSYSLRRISENMNYHSTTLRKLDFRIRYGIKEELTDLVGIKGVGRVRARKLYNAGIKSYDDILENKEKISNLLGRKIAENIINEVRKII